MKRLLRTANAAQDIQFETGRSFPIAFFVWDGSNGETGGKMALTSWYYFLHGAGASQDSLCLSGHGSGCCRGASSGGRSAGCAGGKGQ
jgi:hypothetical protein